MIIRDGPCPNCGAAVSYRLPGDDGHLYCPSCLQEPDQDASQNRAGPDRTCGNCKFWVQFQVGHGSCFWAQQNLPPWMLKDMDEDSDFGFTGPPSTDMKCPAWKLKE